MVDNQKLTKHLHGRESFLEANSHSACQEILRILWNMKGHYLVYMIPLLVPVLS